MHQNPTEQQQKEARRRIGSNALLITRYLAQEREPKKHGRIDTYSDERIWIIEDTYTNAVSIYSIDAQNHPEATTSRQMKVPHIEVYRYWSRDGVTVDRAGEWERHVEAIAEIARSKELVADTERELKEEVEQRKRYGAVDLGWERTS